MGKILKKAIIGAGGFGREVFYHMTSCSDDYIIELFDDGINKYRTIKEIDFDEFEVVVAIGDPTMRRKVVEGLPKEVKFYTFIFPGVTILDSDIKIGEGSIICAGVVLTTNINIGVHSHLNLNTTIGHDCIIGDYFTTTPGVNISGNCVIGNNVYIGTNSSVREKTKIVDNVIVGLNSGVVKDLLTPGIYGGCPSKKIK